MSQAVATPSRSINKKFVIWWLASVCVLIFAIVVVGGITRLTHSGLSMVSWEPIMGVFPPSSELQWARIFAEYQKFPEYKLVNHAMNIEEFKSIFFWEYIHRILGRLIGISLVIPYFILLLSGKLTRWWSKKLLFAIFLVGLQGLLGWVMVKSGLVDVPRVSHYRLAAHLSLAFLIFSYLLWLIMNLVFDAEGESAPAIWRKFSAGFIAIVCLQVAYGAFVAGLKAGFMYNSFPKMGESWIPQGLLGISPLWHNVLENGITVQFIHRVLAWFILITTVIFCYFGKTSLQQRRQRVGVYLLLLAVLLQFVIGVATLLLHVPTPLAVLHQAVALLLLSAALHFHHSLSGRI